VRILKGGSRLASWDKDNIMLWNLQADNSDTNPSLVTPLDRAPLEHTIFFDQGRQLMIRKGIGMVFHLFGIHDLKFNRHTSPIMSMLELENGRLVISCSEKELIVWSATEGKFLTSFDFGKEMLTIYGTRITPRKNIAIFCANNMALFSRIRS